MGRAVAIASNNASLSIYMYKHGSVYSPFVLMHEVNDCVRTGLWKGYFFIYINSSWILKYYIGGQVTTIFDLDKPMYLLGCRGFRYWIYLIDRAFNVVRYRLGCEVIRFLSKIMESVYDSYCMNITTLFCWRDLPKEHCNSVARFLESLGMIKEAQRVLKIKQMKGPLDIRDIDREGRDIVETGDIRDINDVFDLFGMEGRDAIPIKHHFGPFGTKEEPAVIKSDYDVELVECEGGEGEDEHHGLLFRLWKEEPFYCPLCAQYYVLEREGSGDDIDN